VKALIIGLGGVGQRHARNLRALLGADLELLAYRVRGLSHVVTPTLEADEKQNVERQLDLQSFSDLDAALKQKPQIALICNPSSMHVPIALRCIEAGCDILVEKPLSHSLDGVAELVHAAEAAGRIGMVAYQLRFHPCVRRFTEVLSKNTIGNVLCVRAIVGEYLPGWHPYEDYRQMYASRADLGGGVVLSQIHEFDYLYSIFGTPRRIYALGGHYSDLEIDVEDTASILMECDHHGRSLPIHLQEDYLQRPPIRQCEVIGDKGKVILDLRALSVTTYNEKAEPETFKMEACDRNQLFLDEMQHFLDCVRERKSPLVDLKAGAQSLRMALAVKQSMQSGKVVELATIGSELSPSTAVSDLAHAH